MIKHFGQIYSFYGLGRDDGVDKGEIEGVFYKKDRVRLIDSQTVFTPSSAGKKNTITVCYFEEIRLGKSFYLLNVHLAFGNQEARVEEAKWLGSFSKQLPDGVPVILTGDFNTFPFSPELNLPFYDGGYVERLICEGGNLEDSRLLAVLGHYGPATTTTFSQEEQLNFGKKWSEDSVFLDHVFVNKHVKVITYGVDTAKVNGLFVSDHFPVIVDVLLQD